jgi:hypothetical protein
MEFAAKVYIVTTPEEKVPVSVSGVSNVEIWRTAAFFDKGALFNKSAAIHQTQRKVHDLHPNAWILLLDADIVAMPDLCHDVFCKLTLYSVCRMDYLTPEDYIQENGTPYHTPGAGYFQLYFDKTKVYPESSEDASECDMDFYRSFSRHHILGGYVSHLGIHTVNWDGRKSAPWILN